MQINKANAYKYLGTEVAQLYYYFSNHIEAHKAHKKDYKKEETFHFKVI